MHNAVYEEYVSAQAVKEARANDQKKGTLLGGFVKLEVKKYKANNLKQIYIFETLLTSYLANWSGSAHFWAGTARG